MKNINIAEILKDCPKGTKLYSPLCGECYFDSLNHGTIICKTQNTQEITFTSEGCSMIPVFDGCECMLFPSKENRNWNTFQKPIKNGDVVTYKLRGCLIAFIYKERTSTMLVKSHFTLYEQNMGFLVGNEIALKENELVFATEEEKQKLFDAIKTNGYKWNAETKTLEKLIVPKFKVGDKIKLKKSPNNIIGTVTKINEDGSLTVNDYSWVIKYDIQDKYELVPNKFDITTLKPFDKVLVRDGDEFIWKATLFGFKDKNQHYSFVCINDAYIQCIPYEGNEHLLGTKDACSNSYKVWE